MLTLGDIVWRVPVGMYDEPYEPRKRKAANQPPRVEKKPRKGTVVYLHPKGRYHGVAFDTPHGPVIQCFKGVEG